LGINRTESRRIEIVVVGFAQIGSKAENREWIFFEFFWGANT
jgi:hypothetical protein